MVSQKYSPHTFPTPSHIALSLTPHLPHCSLPYCSLHCTRLTTCIQKTKRQRWKRPSTCESVMVTVTTSFAYHPHLFITFTSPLHHPSPHLQGPASCMSISNQVNTVRSIPLQTRILLVTNNCALVSRSGESVSAERISESSFEGAFVLV